MADLLSELYLALKNDNKKIAIYVDNHFIAKCGRVKQCCFARLLFFCQIVL